MWMGRFRKLVHTETDQVACCDGIDRKMRRLDVDGQVSQTCLHKNQTSRVPKTIDIIGK
jgi:hypothetical protein